MRLLLVICGLALLVACGEDDAAAPEQSSQHMVAAPSITGPTTVRYGETACWSLTSFGVTCSEGHPVVVGVGVNAQPSTYAETAEECRSNIHAALTVYGVAQCTVDTGVRVVSTRQVSVE